MSTFTFSSYDIGNSPIVPNQEGSLSFAIHMQRGFLDQPKETTLTAHGVEDNALNGAIDWTKKTIEVKGVVKPFGEVKHKVGGALSL
jgi:hypothetical protein